VSAELGSASRIGRADFNALLEARLIGGARPTGARIWDGGIPAPVVPAER
jgi:hypothetical protein